MWMVVDYDLFTPGAPLPLATMGIVEQLPGFLKSADVTYILRCV